VNALERLLVQRIEREGPISFRDFMAQALYHPEHGYYTTGKPWQGRGDFTTAPRYGETFALCVARFLAFTRDTMGKGAFEAVEVGAGSGLLAEQLARLLGDTGIRLRVVERRRPDRLPATVPWSATSAGFEVRGVLFSNELFDALPVHVVRGTPEGPREDFVGVAGGKLEGVPRVPSRTVLEYLERFRIAPESGEVVEVGLDALAMLREMGAALHQGLLLTVDYGDEARRLRHHAQGTLAAVKDHRASPDPLADPGEQDLTSHVNFTALEEEGRSLGLETIARVPQWQFLAAFGALDDLAAKLQDPKLALEALAAKQLLVPGRMGEFQVLVQSRGLDERVRSAIRARLQGPNLRT
jgi:SAM-dependent MidA family methyltransferase